MFKLTGRLAGLCSMFSVLLLGCGSSGTPTNKVDEPASTFPVVPIVEAKPTEPAKPAVTPTTKPAKPVMPFNTAPPVFVPPSSPVFGGSEPGLPAPTNPTPGSNTPTTPATTPTPTVKPDPTKPEAMKPAEVDKPAEKPSAEVVTEEKFEWPKSVGGKSLEQWLALLKIDANNGLPVEQDAQMRELAVRNLVTFGPSARDAAVKPLIVSLTSDPDPGVQVAAITVISSMGFDFRAKTKPVIEVLRRRLANPETNSIVKMYCVRSLASFGSDARAVPSVVATIGARSQTNNPSWETRREVAIALGIIGSPEPGKSPSDPPNPPSEEAMNVLMDHMLNDKCVAVRAEVAKSLLMIGPPRPKNPADYAENIKKFLVKVKPRLDYEAKHKNGDKGVYVWLLLLEIMYDDRTLDENVKKIGEIAATKGEEPYHRLQALQALGAMGLKAEKGVPQIVTALSYPEYELQYTAMMALCRIGNPARGAIAKLEEIKSMEPKVPPNAPKGFIPDDSLQKMAAETIDYILGKKKFEDLQEKAKEEKKKANGTG